MNYNNFEGIFAYLLTLFIGFGVSYLAVQLFYLLIDREDKSDDRP